MENGRIIDYTDMDGTQLSNYFAWMREQPIPQSPSRSNQDIRTELSTSVTTRISAFEEMYRGERRADSPRQWLTNDSLAFIHLAAILLVTTALIHNNRQRRSRT